LETAVDKYRKELDRMRLLTEQLQQRVAVAEEKGRTGVGKNQDIGDTAQKHWGSMGLVTRILVLRDVAFITEEAGQAELNKVNHVARWTIGPK